MGKLGAENDIMIIIEEGSIGGFGSIVMNELSKSNLLDSGDLLVRTMCLPNRDIEAGNREWQLECAGLESSNIVDEIEKLLDAKRVRERKLLDEGFNGFKNNRTKKQKIKYNKKNEI